MSAAVRAIGKKGVKLQFSVMQCDSLIVRKVDVGRPTYF